MSDNSFFPPLRKVQSCIVLKAICESQRQVGRRRVCGRDLSHCGLPRKPQSWGSKVEKPTRKLHIRVFLYTWREGLAWVESQSAGTRWCRQLCEILSASICHQDLANNNVWGIPEDGDIRRKLKLRVKCFSLQQKGEKPIRDPDTTTYICLIPLSEKTGTTFVLFVQIVGNNCSLTDIFTLVPKPTYWGEKKKLRISLMLEKTLVVIISLWFLLCNFHLLEYSKMSTTGLVVSVSCPSRFKLSAAQRSEKSSSS